MSTSMRRLVPVLAAAALLAAAVPALAGDVVKVGQNANGKTVRLDVGDTLVVSLAGNATTGYEWTVAAIDLKVLKPAGKQYVPKKVAPGIVGAGGTYVLRFRAAAAGKTALKLAYARPWEKGVKPARTFSLTVAVG